MGNFNFFVPVDIEKGKKGSNEAVKIKGVASTRDVDSDQEVLEPSGFVLNKFLKSGFFNYNHKSSTEPTAIVGEPTDAFVKGGELIVEGFLYGDSQKAQEIIDLAKVLKKNSPNRRLGLSIEGRALARDPFNKKRITKALITGCAITPTPKNSNTLVDVIKGEGSSYIEPVYESIDPNGGDVEYIIDVVDGDGIRRTVDKDLNIKVVKMTTGDMAPAYPESVEGTKRKGKRGIKNVAGHDFFEKNTKTFTKSEVYEQIFRIFTNDIIKSKEIYSLIEQIESLKSPNMDKIKITPESIQKAKEILALASEETVEADVVIKSEEEAKPEEEAASAAKPEEEVVVEGDEPIVKSEDNDEDDEDEYGDIKDEGVKKALQGFSKAIADMTSKISTITMPVGKQAGSKEEDLGHPEEDKNGGQITKVVAKSETDDLGTEAKVNSDPSATNAEIVKGVVDSLNPKFTALGQLYVDQKEKNEELEATITKALDRVEELEGQPTPAKLITKGFQDRFEEGSDGKSVEGMTVMSISNDRNSITDKLFELSNIEKGENVDKDMVTAIGDLEASGTFSNPKIVNRLADEYQIRIVK